MSYEEDYLMAEMAKVKERVAALEAIVTRPQSLQPEVLHTESLYSEFSLEELRAELKGRGLPTSGNKPELVTRLEADDADAGAGDGAG